MKKIISFVLFAVFISTYAQEPISVPKIEKTKAIKNGINLSISTSLNSSEIGLYYPQYDWKETTYYQLQFGTRWYIKPQEKWALGILGTWIDFSIIENMGALDDSNPIESYKYNKVITYSFLGIGPIGTWAFNDNLAADIYYNIRPTYILAQSNINDIGIQPGFGFSNVAGGAVRIGVFNLGVEYVFGTINSLNDHLVNSIGSATGENLESSKTGELNNKCVRLVVGCKF